VDRFGDNGIIAIIIGKKEACDLWIDTWLMSCRVLGRQVEQATLNLIIEQARRLGAKSLIGEYLPTPKNGMVKDHYIRLGFAVKTVAEDGAGIAVLDLETAQQSETFIKVKEG
jgi:FkbH-like protein